MGVANGQRLDRLSHRSTRKDASEENRSTGRRVVQHIEACEGQLQLGLSPYMAEDYGAGREELCVGAPSGHWSVFHDVRFDGLEDVVRRCRLLAADFPEPFVLGWIMEEFSQSHPDLVRSVLRRWIGSSRRRRPCREVGTAVWHSHAVWATRMDPLTVSVVAAYRDAELPPVCFRGRSALP